MFLDRQVLRSEVKSWLAFEIRTRISSSPSSLVDTLDPYFPIYQDRFIVSATHPQVPCLLNVDLQAYVPCCSCQGIGLILHALVSVDKQHNIICIIKVFQDTGQGPSYPFSYTTSQLPQNPVDPQDKNKGGEDTPLFYTRGHAEGICKRCVANNLGLEITVKHLDDICQL